MVTGSAPYNKYPPMKVILLTLQNNAPNLDTVSSENKDKYKKYSKDIRKFISKCLQKEPGKRPPSKDLLKDSFFKKSKSNSKEFIVNRKESFPQFFGKVLKINGHELNRVLLGRTLTVLDDLFSSPWTVHFQPDSFFVRLVIFFGELK